MTGNILTQHWKTVGANKVVTLTGNHPICEVPSITPAPDSENVNAGVPARIVKDHNESLINPLELTRAAQRLIGILENGYIEVHPRNEQMLTAIDDLRKQLSREYQNTEEEVRMR